MLATEAPFPQYFDTDGDPLDGGKLYFGAPNQDPQTAPIPVYWDAAGTQPAAQPIRTMNGYAARSGTPATVYVEGDYSINVRNKMGELVYYAANSAGFSNDTVFAQFIDDLADAADPAKGDALVAVKNLAAGGVARTQHTKNADFIHVNDFGAVGDGVADDATAILNALAAGVARGLPVFFDGAKTYLISLMQWSIPTGSVLCTSGATFRCSTTTTGNEHWVTVNANARIDQLKVTISASIRRDRAILITGDNIRIETVALVSTDQQANGTQSDDAGVNIIGGERIAVGVLTVANYDRAAAIGNTVSCTIGRFDVTSYIRGAWIYDNAGLVISSGYLHTASPNPGGTSGDNGLLFGCTVAYAQRYVQISNFRVENASEHGIRVAGPARQSIKFSNCSAFNVGGNGLKVLGTDAGAPTDTNCDIVIAGFIAEDVGLDAAISAPNRSGLNIGFTNGAQISGLIVRKRNAPWAAQYGLNIRGCSNIVVDAPLIMDCQLDGIYLDATQEDNNTINIHGGMSRSNGQHGVHILTGAAFSTRRAYVDGISLESNTGRGFNVNVIAGGGFVANMIRAKLYNNTAGMGASNSNTGITLELSGDVGATPIAGILARGGSWIDDTVTLNYRKAGAWVAL